MLSISPHERPRLGSAGSWLMYALALCVCVTSAIPARAQNAKKKKNEPEIESGTIVSIDREKKGKTILKIKKSGSDDEMEVTLTAKTAVSISAKGDKDFLQPGVVLSGKVTLQNPGDTANKQAQTVFSAFSAVTIFAALANNANNSKEKLVGKEFKVHLGPSTPSTQVTPQQDDFNMNQYEVCGVIEGLTEDKAIMVDFGENGTQKIFLETGTNSVDVELSDPALLKEGAEVEIEGHTKGKVFLPTKVSSKLDDQLTAEEYIVSQQKKGSKSKKANARPKKPRVDNFDDP